MSMIVEILFVKLEGRNRDVVRAHYTEVIDVADEKSIGRCWDVVAQKFSIPRNRLHIFEGYLTQSEVLPTSDDLQRIWLSYLANEEGRIDPDLCHLCLRFFASETGAGGSGGVLQDSARFESEKSASDQSKSDASQSHVPSVSPSHPNSSASPVASASATTFAGRSAGVAATLGPNPAQTAKDSLTEQILGRGETWVRIAEELNRQVLLSVQPGSSGSSDSRELIRKNARVIELLGRGSTAVWKLWYLFTQTDFSKTSESLLTRFPALQAQTDVVRNLPDAVQIFQIVSMMSSLLAAPPSPTTAGSASSATAAAAPPETNGVVGLQNTKIQSNVGLGQRTFDAVEEYVRRLPLNNSPLLDQSPMWPANFPDEVTYPKPRPDPDFYTPNSAGVSLYEHKRGTSSPKRHVVSKATDANLKPSDVACKTDQVVSKTAEVVCKTTQADNAMSSIMTQPPGLAPTSAVYAPDTSKAKDATASDAKQPSSDVLLATRVSAISLPSSDSTPVSKPSPPLVVSSGQGSIGLESVVDNKPKDSLFNPI